MAHITCYRVRVSNDNINIMDERGRMRNNVTETCFRVSLRLFESVALLKETETNP